MFSFISHSVRITAAASGCIVETVDQHLANCVASIYTYLDRQQNGSRIQLTLQESAEEVKATLKTYNVSTS